MGFLNYFILAFLFVSCIKANEVVQTNGCDLSQGRWVFDKTYPLYDMNTCPFIDGEFNCQKNGRRDQNYLKYKWQPNACPLARFDGAQFLSKLRGKKILFVGDSISFNQWQSLTCLLHATAPRAKYIFKPRQSITFPITIGGTPVTSPSKLCPLINLDEEYGVSVTLITDHFLVDLVQDPKLGRVMKLDTISSDNHWKGYDVAIFNTYHWWNHKGKMQPWDYISTGGKMFRDMDRLVVFQHALTTWGNWVDSNIDTSKTKVFWQGVSPQHNRVTGQQTQTGTCLGETGPATRPGVDPDTLAVPVVKRVLSKMKKQVTLLDITAASELRKDGHPSIYGTVGKGSDCSHWCIAGVPDTWNEFLYHFLV